MPVKQEIEVIIDGTKFIGWNSVNVTRVIGELCGDFSFSLVDFPIGSTKNIIPGSEVSIEMTGKPLSHKIINGYIDKVTRNKTSDETSLEFSGRDKTSDLIDCSAAFKNSSWKKKTVSQICKDICDPFGIIVTLDTNDTLVEDFALQTGETAFAAIERLTRAYSILPLTDELGRLKLSKIGIKKSAVQLKVGDNVKSLTLEEDHSGRYSEYFARGQGKGNGASWLKNTIDLQGRCLDFGVERHRPFIFIAEKRMSPTEIQKRVNWEAQVRAGRAIRCNVVVQGWLQDPTDQFSFPWTVNEIVNLVDRNWGINSNFVISSVTYNLDNAGGRITSLELSPPEIFASDPSDKVQLSRKSSVRPNP